MKHFNLILIIFAFACRPAFAQTPSVGNFQVDERELYAMTKQVSQFFSRFNYEEDQIWQKIPS